jgi:hypothetical protein
MTDATQPQPDNKPENNDGESEKPIPTLWEQMGGMVGFISASIPVAVFVIVNWASSMGPAIWSAVGVAVLIAIWRIVRKEQLMPAISGIFGVAIAAFIAYRVGEAKGFFLYGIWVSGALGVACLVSILARWPAVGVAWGALNGHGMGWRSDLKSRRDYDIATAAWALVFVARVVVQQWLYNVDKTTLLGIARIGMGYPLTAVALLVTVWAVRRSDHRQKEHEEAEQLAAEQAKAEDAAIEQELRKKYETPAQESS